MEWQTEITIPGFKTPKSKYGEVYRTETWFAWMPYRIGNRTKWLETVSAVVSVPWSVTMGIGDPEYVKWIDIKIKPASIWQYILIYSPIKF